MQYSTKLCKPSKHNLIQVKQLKTFYTNLLGSICYLPCNLTAKTAA